jgi:alkylation response protein AidB-like acyl-CoA dehydrogenase
MTQFSFDAPPLSPEAEQLRGEVREFLRTELAGSTALQRAESWNGWSAEFSAKVGARGWIGMTWPKRYGGHERSALERYVVLEEMLAHGAPVSAHWIADRQSGPLLLRWGSEKQRQEVLPRIARGECFTCIGLSEPDVGSDLAAVRTKAVAVDGGYRVNGTKVWNTNGHHSHYMVLFCRTGEAAERHQGLSQFLVEMTTPGIEVRPIIALTGEHHFNEIVFNDVFVPADDVIGTIGEGWQQVTSELANERSGPERFLSSFALLVELVRVLGTAQSDQATAAVGRLVANIVVLRRMSRSVAGMLQSGPDPMLQAAIVKDLGAIIEQEIPEIARSLIGAEPTSEAATGFSAVLAYTALHAPSFSLRGGTREILRGIIARGLGLR